MSLLLESVVNVDKEQLYQFNNGGHVPYPMPLFEYKIKLTPLYIYKLTWDRTGRPLYQDYYDSAIVIAKDETEAKTIHPDPKAVFNKYENRWYDEDGDDYVEYNQFKWANSPSSVLVEKIGVSVNMSPVIKSGVILASYNSF